ncbi:hypothetical protein B9Z55_021664 [Caenorhabditis nigoni]|uniref:C-type lectin domain-containing protein n=1 Tax=Caenorhabditis nigoni TaxID=1611254 RepID=A0A2G5TT01_9PELO|nr:hypothetical protein B9Z55_021664 [Caenorhabditis nigoni]
MQENPASKTEVTNYPYFINNSSILDSETYKTNINDFFQIPEKNDNVEGPYEYIPEFPEPENSNFSKTNWKLLLGLLALILTLLTLVLIAVYVIVPWIQYKQTHFYSDNTNCPMGFDFVHDKCLRIEKTPQTWFEARSLCSNFPGRSLVSINSEAENEAINNFMENSNLKSLWIGLYCLGNDKSQCVWDGQHGEGTDSYTNFGQFWDPWIP